MNIRFPVGARLRLKELCTLQPRRGNLEQEITDLFVQSGVLPGIVRQQLKIGRQRVETEIGVFDWRRKIDLIVERDDGHWVLECKQRLTHEALGQVLSYSLLYQLEHPTLQVHKGIVCAQMNGELLYVCHHHGVIVFQVEQDRVKVHAPEGFPGPAPIETKSTET
jgi:hypothetical protein